MMALHTFPSDKPVRQIDYVITRPVQLWKPIEMRVIDEAIASDHRPLLTVWTLNESAR
jgi:endonuclease/exonuclease/phosphatase family metal-dependent hydrolase